MTLMTLNPYKYVENWHDVLHADVIRMLRDLYSIYESSTDSDLDEFDGELTSILDPEIAHDNAYSWRMDDDGTITDVDRRNAETEIAQYTAIRTHLSTFDMEVLHFIPDVWFVAEDARNQMEWEEHMFAHLFNIADFIERNKTA